ncbi:Tyrosinase [Cladobotryum mycophilum]|uniref:tyrosinase n=1 Tax=Cladobotryum mycophilum TaxID=491253 RepID=A0ABR0T0D9_9HYPO
MASPFVGGGYCNHGNVLFPTWHRAYLLRLENALRSVEGCENVTLPYWDELLDPENPIPAILTSPTFPLVGGEPNPLYSYTFQETLVENVAGADSRYTKPVGYAMVRYPRSGLVGTSVDITATDVHNVAYVDEAKAANLLNKNFAVGSNSASKPPTIPSFPTPALRTSGSRTSTRRIRGIYNADPIIGANGDMGDNETAGFDPIFFFNHCFIDYVFWREYYPGTIVTQNGGTPFLPPGTALDMDTPLYPFRKPDQTYYSSHDVTDITELGYTYELESLASRPENDAPQSESKIIGFKHTHNINRADHPGSFVVRTFIGTNDEDKIEVGREAVLSRRNIAGYADCQDKLDVESLVPIYEGMVETLFGSKNLEKIKYSAEIHTHHAFKHEFLNSKKAPIIGDL